MNVSEAIAAGLVAHDVRKLFGLMGDGNMLLMSSFAEADGTDVVCAAHEGGAVLMADGYHRMQGGVGVATVTHGPGLTNAITALTESVRAGSSLVVITSETPLRRAHAQAIDIESVASLCGAGFERVWGADTCGDDLSIAIARARDERRPILLDMPARLITTPTTSRPSRPLPTRVVGAPDPDVVDRALGAIASASAPLVVAGRGVALAGARENVAAVAAALGAPLATTLLAKGLFNGLDGDIGVVGTLATRRAFDVVSRSDCLVTFGASLSRHTAADGTLTAGKRVVQCGDGGRASSRFVVPHVDVVGDLHDICTQFRDGLVAIEHVPSSFAASVPPHADGVVLTAADSGPPSARAFLARLARRLPHPRQVVTDVGRYVVGAWHVLDATEPHRFTHAGNFGSIGLGLATAIGASIAAPHALTVLVVGDGGLAMSTQELATAWRERCRLLIIVMNNGSYAAEYEKLIGYGVDPRHSLISWPSFADVAEGFGITGRTIRTLDDVDSLVSLVERTSRPVLADVIIDPADVVDWDGTELRLAEAVA